ncbi:MAG: hypothetical protein N2319_10245 [Candidatus Kapabacteria bacterium]|nr:hypothetical protein [Candidatus Kapabacteria bacterium]
MKKLIFTVVSALLIFFSFSLVMSKVPEIISYQCFVKDFDNVPLNGNYQVTFSIYDKEDSQESIWKETIDATFNNGFANLYLGKKQSLANIDFSKKYWFSMTIGSGEEFKPRLELTSTPYSLMAKSVDASSGSEGSVLTIVAGKAQWVPAGGLLKLPFVGSTDTSGPALQIHQKGRGSSAVFQRLVVPKKPKIDKGNNIPLALDSKDTVDTNNYKPVLEVKDIHEIKKDIDIDHINLVETVFGSQGAFVFVPFLSKKNNNDSPMDVKEYYGNKAVGFFCLDSVFGVDRYSEIAEEYPTAIYARTLSRMGNAGRFITEHPNNEHSTIYVKNNGVGNAAVFHNFNEKNADYPAVVIRNKSLSNSLTVYHDNPNNTVPAVAIVNSGSDDYGLYSKAIANSGAAKFEQTDSNANTRPCMLVRAVGLVNALNAFSMNPNSTYPVIGVRGYNSGAGLSVRCMNTLNDSSALIVEQQGKGPTAQFYISNSNNGAVSVVGNTWGLGRAGQFAVLNTANNQTALGGITVGTGTAISGYTNSTKAFSGVFYTDNTQNTESCFFATTTGQGFVGQFVAPNNQPNNRSTIYGGTTGRGNAGEFIVVSNDNSMTAVYGYHNNKGTAIYGKHEGTGRTASFEQMNQANGEPTVFASAKGAGPAIYARNDGRGYSAQFTIANNTNNDSPVLIVDNKRGRKGAVIQSNADTDEPALEVVKGGTNNQAAYFSGNVRINGTLSKQAGAFIIDHPLDPENKYLSHSFVESPDMKNIYDGVVVLDENGEATVELPAWFQALNKDFRYQLTCIGGYAQVYISQEIENNKFKIAGGRKNLKVSWQVTGIRHDKYAEKYPIIVEKEKPENEKGTLLCPENDYDKKGYKNREKILGIVNTYENLNIDFNRPENKEEIIRTMILNNDFQKPVIENEINDEKIY